MLKNTTFIKLFMFCLPKYQKNIVVRNKHFIVPFILLYFYGFGNFFNCFTSCFLTSEINKFYFCNKYVFKQL